jgi:hypothetical protein
MTEDREPTANDESDQEFLHLLTQMQQQICELEHDLDECKDRLLSHPVDMHTIRHALNIAKQSTACLLTDNPFEAWDQFVEEDEFGVYCDTSTARMQQAETTTRRCDKEIG